jgi:hypothetical protein
MSFRDELPAHPLPLPLYTRKVAVAVETPIFPSFEDDFLAGTSLWRTTGAIASVTRAEAAHPGISRLLTVGAIDEIVAVNYGESETAMFCAWSDVDTVTFIGTPFFNPSAPAAALVRIGLFSDIASDTPAHGVYFEKQTALSVMRGVSRNLGSQAVTDNFETTLVSGIWHTLRVRRVSDFSVGFKLNEEAEKVVSLDTPAPGAAMQLGVQLLKSTVHQQGFDLDYVKVQFGELVR